MHSFEMLCMVNSILPFTLHKTGEKYLSCKRKEKNLILKRWVGAEREISALATKKMILKRWVGAYERKISALTEVTN